MANLSTLRPSRLHEGPLRAGDEIALFPISRSEMARRQLDLEIEGATVVTLDEGPEWLGRPLSGMLKDILLYVKDTVVRVGDKVVRWGKSAKMALRTGIPEADLPSDQPWATYRGVRVTRALG
jgi:hypothetical protein